MASIELRYENAIVDDCEDVWNELVDADVTASADSAVKKVGAYSAKFVCAAGLAAGDIIATEAISSSNFTDMIGVVCWVRSTVALSAGDIDFMLDDTAQCASPLESIDIPAISVDTWTRVFVPFVTPANLTAVISIGLKMIVDKGAFTFYVDDIRTYNSKTFDRSLAVRGADDPDQVGLWPGLFEEGMDASSYDSTTKFYRMITVDLGVVSTKSDRVFLFKWATKGLNKKHFNRYIVYSSETIAVTIPDISQFQNEWLEDSEIGRAFIFDVREAEALTTIPSSWS